MAKFFFRKALIAPFIGLVIGFICLSANIISPNIVQGNPYAKLSKKLDGELVYLINNKLYFTYNEEYKPNTLRYNVYNKNHEIYYDQSDQALSPAYGDNRFILDFSPTGNCLNTRINILEVINDKGEKLYLRFKQTGTICAGGI